jgi:hypothetical protein
MRISFVDSQRNGFKKWSDAQRPTARMRPGDDPGVHKQQNDPSRAGEDQSVPK